MPCLNVNETNTLQIKVRGQRNTIAHERMSNRVHIHLITRRICN